MCKRKQKYQPPCITTCRNFRGAVLLLTFACSQVAQGMESSAYPKASEDATMVYQLRSNLERTHFLVDNKELGVGRKLMVKLNNQGHKIVAQPENCEISKEESIQPPYSAEAPLSFTFVTGDCEKPVVVADNSNEYGGTSNITVGKGGTVIIGDGNNNNSNNIENNSPPRERVPSSSPKTPQANKQNALNEIKAFVQEVCTSTEDRGKSENFELSGAAKAGLSGLIKSLADLDIEGTAKYQSGEYQGVLQKDLSGLLSKDADCKREITAMLINKFIK